MGDVSRPAGAAPDRARLLEAVGLGVALAALAAAFVALLVESADDERAAGRFVAWAFLPVLGLLDLVASVPGVSWFTELPVLMVTAAAVGGFTGAINGWHRVYEWRRLGGPAALVDATWGLAGSLFGGMVHVANLWSGVRGHAVRNDVVWFVKGVHAPGKPRFALTIGHVMSNLRDPPGTPLHSHERVHVFQSRVFGPVYLASYVLWAAVAVLPAIVVGVVRRQPRSRIEPWCYYSNPWEVWGYGKQRRLRDEPATACNRTRLSGDLCLSEPIAIAFGTPLVGVTIGVFAAVALAVYG